MILCIVLSCQFHRALLPCCGPITVSRKFSFRVRAYSQSPDVPIEVSRLIRWDKSIEVLIHVDQITLDGKERIIADSTKPSLMTRL